VEHKTFLDGKKSWNLVGKGLVLIDCLLVIFLVIVVTG
jgi:hypothetical protein